MTALLLHQLPYLQAERAPSSVALVYGDKSWSYEELVAQIAHWRRALQGLGLQTGDRIAVYQEKSLDCVAAMFAVTAAGGILVPVNPVLKPRQLAFIVRDCEVRVLITTSQRCEAAKSDLAECASLQHVVVSDSLTQQFGGDLSVLEFAALPLSDLEPVRLIENDVAALLYTSGSTGNPKGVILTHRNMVSGARSVSSYLENSARDTILALLPLSFDAGFSQLTTAFHSGAQCVLHNYLMPRDAIRVLAKKKVTGLTAVPPLWIQLLSQEWPEEVAANLRYFANTGGAMPGTTLNGIRQRVPKALPYLMYGLTEAFRSTYLPPEEAEHRPTSIGKAIPNEQVMVLRPDGSECDIDEAGELVHRGALVARGYWNRPVETAERFKPVGVPVGPVTVFETAVWSGDTVRRDADGYLYFVGRRDDMIKVSGYRISPTEIEDVAYQSGLVKEIAALGVEHPKFGQGIVVVAVSAQDHATETDALLAAYRSSVANYMIPHRVEWHQDSLPKNANGKIDRAALKAVYKNVFVQ